MRRCFCPDRGFYCRFLRRCCGFLQRCSFRNHMRLTFACHAQRMGQAAPAVICFFAVAAALPCHRILHTARYATDLQLSSLYTLCRCTIWMVLAAACCAARLFLFYMDLPVPVRLMASTSTVTTGDTGYWFFCILHLLFFLVARTPLQVAAPLPCGLL